MRLRLSYKFVATDDMAMKGVRASAGMILFKFVWNIPLFTWEGLMSHLVILCVIIMCYCRIFISLLMLTKTSYMVKLIIKKTSSFVTKKKMTLQVMDAESAV